MHSRLACQRSARTVLVYSERKLAASGAKIKGNFKLNLVPLLLPSPVVVQHARLGKPPFWHREGPRAYTRVLHQEFCTYTKRLYRTGHFFQTSESNRVWTDNNNNEGAAFSRSTCTSSRGGLCRTPPRESHSHRLTPTARTAAAPVAAAPPRGARTEQQRPPESLPPAHAGQPSPREAAT